MVKNKKVSNTQVLAESIVCIALSAVLSMIKVYQLPFGGSITLGGMVPILWLALRRGPRIGIGAGLVFGLVIAVIEPFFFSPFQVLLDYPIAFGALGLAGFFKKYPVAGVGVGIFGRFIAHFLSGVIFFWMCAPEGMHPMVYSAVYNGSYLLPELVVSAVIIYILAKAGIMKIYLETP